VIGRHPDPQKAHPWLEPRSPGDFGGDRSSGATWARDEGTKKGKERNLQWQTGCSPRPPTLTQRCMLGGPREVVTSFKFRQNRMNRFRDVGVEICHFLYLRPVAYNNSLYYRTSRDRCWIRTADCSLQETVYNQNRFRSRFIH